MNAKKCCYTIFSSSGNKNNRFSKKIEFDLRLKGDQIPYNPNPLFLGITFDEHLCFNRHIDNLKRRALSRLNIIKIISHSSWHLNLQTLINIFNALIGSIFSYSFFIMANVSQSNLEKLQIVQNQALKRIFKLPEKYPTRLLFQISKVSSVKDRLISQGCKRLTKSLLNNNNTFILVQEYTLAVSSIRRNVGVHTPLCCFLPIVIMALLASMLKFV